MHVRRRAVMTACAAIVVMAAVAKAGEIDWRSNLQDAVQQAAVDRAPVMIDFYADWCGWCKRLDRTTYTNVTVTELAAQMLSVKVNTDRDPMLAERYGIRSLPTIVFLDRTGTEISRIVGFRDAAYFAETMRAALEPRFATSSGGESADDARYAAADLLVASRRYAEAADAWTALARDAESPAVRQDALLERAHTYRLMREWAKALADYTAYAAARPKPARVAEARLFAAHVLRAMKRPRDARPLYEQAAKDARNTWIAHEAERALKMKSREKATS